MNDLRLDDMTDDDLKALWEADRTSYYILKGIVLDRLGTREVASYTWEGKNNE